MTNRKHFNGFASACLIILTVCAAASFSFAQANASAVPRQEKLLNGLKILLWQNQNTDKVTVKLRVHSGAAFDPRGKEGTMALLADALFPNESQRDYFRDDLGGSLEVESNYDYLQISATGDADKILTILEAFAAAVTKPTLDADTTAQVKTARLAKIRELEKNPAYVADLAVVKRLFGDYPYGRSADGTTESLAKIDFADLIFARQRFLTADNATVAVSGDIKYDSVLKAVRQLFGGWTKADKKIPATFAQPSAPDTKELSIASPDSEYGYRDTATIAVGRGDKDFYAMKVLAEIRRTQLCLFDETKRGKSSFDAYLLRGVYTVRSKFLLNQPPQLPAPYSGPCALVLVVDGKSVYPPILKNDFETAKNKVIAESNQKTQSPVDSMNLWLDVDTYKLVSVKDEMQRLNNLSIGDVNQSAAKLQQSPSATVSVGKLN